MPPRQRGRKRRPLTLQSYIIPPNSRDNNIRALHTHLFSFDLNQYAGIAWSDWIQTEMVLSGLLTQSSSNPELRLIPLENLRKYDLNTVELHKEHGRKRKRADDGISFHIARRDSRKIRRLWEFPGFINLLSREYRLVHTVFDEHEEIEAVPTQWLLMFRCGTLDPSKRLCSPAAAGAAPVQPRVARGVQPTGRAGGGAGVHHDGAGTGGIDVDRLRPAQLRALQALREECDFIGEDLVSVSQWKALQLYAAESTMSIKDDSRSLLCRSHALVPVSEYLSDAFVNERLQLRHSSERDLHRLSKKARAVCSLWVAEKEARAATIKPLGTAFLISDRYLMTVFHNLYHHGATVLVNGKSCLSPIASKFYCDFTLGDGQQPYSMSFDRGNIVYPHVSPLKRTISRCFAHRSADSISLPLFCV